MLETEELQYRATEHSLAQERNWRSESDHRALSAEAIANEATQVVRNKWD